MRFTKLILPISAIGLLALLVHTMDFSPLRVSDDPACVARHALIRAAACPQTKHTDETLQRPGFEVSTIAVPPVLGL
jgi:hypothetical protein